MGPGYIVLIVFLWLFVIVLGIICCRDDYIINENRYERRRHRAIENDIKRAAGRGMVGHSTMVAGRRKEQKETEACEGRGFKGDTIVVGEAEEMRVAEPSVSKRRASESGTSGVVGNAVEMGAGVERPASRRGCCC